MPYDAPKLLEPGWPKVRLYAHLLERNNYEDWTVFALVNTAEVVKQSIARGRPCVPRDQRVRTLMFRLPVGVGDELIEALKRRGWQFEPGKKGGRPGEPRDGDERAVRALLKDAKRGGR